MIIVDRVTRTFDKGSVTVLKDVSFAVKKGERVGIVGKNGVGKTTLLKMIVGILKPSFGRIWTMDQEAAKALEQNRLRIGCLFASYSQLMPSFSLEEAFEWQRALYHIHNSAFEQMFESVGRRLGLHNFYRQALKNLSVGQKRRGEFFAAVMHKPDLLALDEPTIGMDEESRSIVNDVVYYLNQTLGVTVLTASHDLQSLKRTSERVLLLRDGKLDFDGKWEALQKKADYWRQAIFEADQFIDLEDIPVQFISYENGKLELLYRESQISTENLLAFLSKQTQIQNFSVSEPALEKIVSKILKGET